MSNNSNTTKPTFYTSRSAANRKRVDHSGEKFNRLTIIKLAYVNKYRTSVWECLCECGKTVYKIYPELVTGSSKSCGCWSVERFTKQVTKHNQSQHKSEYKIWTGLKQRCDNPKNPAYKYYGERGISYCPEWSRFENFYADMGDRPSPNHQLERKDNSKGYTPENCKWATRNEQMVNTRWNRNITHNGKTLCVSEWARVLGLSVSGMRWRLDKWGIEKAFSRGVL